MWLERVRPWQVILLAGLVRSALVLWAEYQDHHFTVKYTDIDYKVFTDAARFVAAGGSPYQRSTFRYSPLLAYLMLPNIWAHPAWGKVLFSASDLVAASLLDFLLRRCGASQQHRTVALGTWLFNPYTATISTRGSCDVLSVLLLLFLLIGLLYGKPITSGALYGLAVHFRIYPVIYGPAIALFLMRRELELNALARSSSEGPGTAGGAVAATAAAAGGTPHTAATATVGAAAAGDHRTVIQAATSAERPHQQRPRKHVYINQGEIGPVAACEQTSSLQPCWFRSTDGRLGVAAFMAVALRPVLLFGMAAAGSFLLLGGLFYRLYGREFLQEAFLHHLTRKDPRHNFSPYYYPVYLSYGDRTMVYGGREEAAAGYAGAANAASVADSGGVLRPLRWLLAAWHVVRRAIPAEEPWRLAMLPQIIALLAFAFRLYEDIPSAWLLQTWSFVTLNKVVTAQYFVWYLSLLPLVLPVLAVQRAVQHTALAAGGVAWVAAQLHWLAWAYQLEMKGRSVHLPLWVAGLTFQVANTTLIVLLTRALIWRLRRRTNGNGSDGGISEFSGSMMRTPASPIRPAVAPTDVGSGINGSGGGGNTGLPAQLVKPFSDSGMMTFLEASLQLRRLHPLSVMARARHQKQQ